MRNPNRYAAVLRIREQAEDRQAQVVALVRNRLQIARKERTSLELTRQSALEQAGTTLQQHFDASDIRSYYQYERHLAGLRDRKDAEIRTLLQEESAEVKLLEKVSQARQIAEKLHERRREAYRNFLLKEEQKALDETANKYAARRIQEAVAAARRGGTS
jgi:flagellar export protein FliJ